MKNISTALGEKLLYTIFAVLIYRFGSFIPVPGLDSILLTKVVDNNKEGILGIFNMLSGGSLGRMSIFALAIMPYITASILIQLMTVIHKPLGDLKKEGEVGRLKIIQISRCLTILFASVQAYGVSVGLESTMVNYGNLILIPFFLFKISTVITLVVGTLFLMWLGEQISTNGIGNGSSIIIFVGIISGLPNGVISMFELLRKGVLFPGVVFIICIGLLSLFFTIIFFESAQRRVLVQYPKRQIGMKLYSGDVSHIPIKLNTAGVIPPIFASSILLLPTTIVGFWGNSDFFGFISRHLGHGKPVFVILYAILIVFFSFVYSGIVFPSDETANNLKKHGAYILGKRPGKNTSNYLDFVLTRITLLGSVYLVVICIVPEFFINKYSVSFSLGGTSLLIIVNVVLDTFSQAQSHLFGERYNSLLKETKLLQ